MPLRRAAGNVVEWCANLRPSFRRSIFKHVSIGLAQVTMDGHLLAVNDRLCGLVERSSETLGRLRMHDLIDGADVPAFQSAMARLAQHGGSFTQELRLQTPDRRTVWVEIAASPLTERRKLPRSAVLVVSDISARIRSDARAKETERRFREVADAAPVFIWISGTDRQRRHTWMNTRWADFSGRPLEDELGSGWTSGVHPDDLPACLALYWSAFDRRGAFTGEYRLRRHDGEYRWMLDTGTPIHDDHGQFVGYIGSLIDITDRKTAEAEREALLAGERTARSEAEQANRLKDEFLSILSHELRTPLNAVLGWVHVLQASVGGAGEIGRGLAVIERNARLQGRMVDDLLDLGGVITGKMRLEMRALAIDQVVDGALESLQPAFAAKRVRLRRVIDANDVEIYGDLNRLQQVVWNLLSNALKFTPSDGEVAVELHRSPGLVCIRVRDNGQGISPEFLPFVFERFRQGDASSRRSSGGLGIGLALVKSLTELHGGSVSAESAGLGRGSTFTVTLPCAASRAAEPRVLAHGLTDRSQGLPSAKASMGDRL